MTTFKRFEDMPVWNDARCLTADIYALTMNGELSRDFGLRDQIRRSAVSIMSNIAEGFERDGNRELKQYLSLAKASAGELRSQLYILIDVNFINRKTFISLRNQCESVTRQLDGFMSYIENSPLNGRKHPVQTKHETAAD